MESLKETEEKFHLEFPCEDPHQNVQEVALAAMRWGFSMGRAVVLGRVGELQQKLDFMAEALGGGVNLKGRALDPSEKEAFEERIEELTQEIKLNHEYIEEWENEDPFFELCKRFVDIAVRSGEAKGHTYSMCLACSDEWALGDPDDFEHKEGCPVLQYDDLVEKHLQAQGKGFESEDEGASENKNRRVAGF